MKKSVYLIVSIILISFSCQNKKANEQVEDYIPVNNNVKLNAFPYAPPKPIKGALYGLVELGGSGFNSFIIEKDNADRWKLIKSEYGESKIIENEMDPMEIRNGLKSYVDVMLEKGVAKDRIFFIQSSTASMDEKVQKLNPILEELGYTVISVDVQKEAMYAFYATMPKEFEDEAYVMDLGSGNTKISWIENDSLIRRDTYGSKYYQQELSDSAVYKNVYDIISEIPAGNRKKCFIIGGVPYKLASQNQEFAEHYTVLGAADSYAFDDPKLVAGLNIYKAAMDASPEYEGFIFDWYSNFTIGYLLREL